MPGDIVAFVQDALRRTDRLGTRAVLARIAGEFGAYGVILWDDATESDGEGRLYSVADWFEDERRWSRHDLPLQSLTGEAIQTGEPVAVSDIDGRINRDTAFFARHGIKHVACFPMAGKRLGALNLYWRNAWEGAPVLIERGRQYSQLLPFLHHSIQTAFRFDLVSGVRDIFERAAVPNAGDETLAFAGKTLQQAVDWIARGFHCLEVSAFLEDPGVAPGEFVCRATSWREFVYADRYTASSVGLTAWVVRERRPLQLFDLRHLGRDRARILKRYPGLEWVDRVQHVSGVVRQELRIRPNEELPALSFMAAPIQAGNRLLGVIRCCTARQSPDYFSQSDTEALSTIALQIGQFWQRYVAGVEAAREIAVWREHAVAVQRLNQVAAGELGRQPVNERLILNYCVRDLCGVLPTADVLDIRLWDEARKDLYFAAVGGRLWDSLTEAERRSKFETRYPVDKSKPGSIGAYVYSNRATYVMKERRGDRFYREIFEDLRQEIVVPIGMEQERYGVLSIGTTSKRPMGEFVGSIAEMMGQQVGLYINLARSLRKLQKAEGALERTVTEGAQAYEDFQHQIRSPLKLAEIRLQSELAAKDLSSDRLASLQALRGLIAKARQVGLNLDVFVKLARKEPLDLRRTRLTGSRAYKLVWELCEDNRRVHRARGVIPEIYRTGLDDLDRASVSVDYQAFVQALSNILDNAFKYAYRQTAVRVDAGVVGNEFFLNVSNQGIPIRDKQIAQFRKRGIRGREAKLVTGEGSGLGLWIVDQIMPAMGGRCEIHATSPEGWTKVQLVLRN